MKFSFEINSERAYDFLLKLFALWHLLHHLL
jgi:hypothetical protein